MIDITFKNLEKSELAREVVTEQMEGLIERFPDLADGRVVITLSMHNSPLQAGPDVFAVKFQCKSGKYKGAILEKRESNLYKALSDLSDQLSERLNRVVEKERVKNIKKARSHKRKARHLLREYEKSVS